MDPEEQIFSCQMCGECCYGEGGIVVSSRDIQRLGRFLELPPEEIERRFCRRSGDKTALRCGPDGFCIFFEPGRGCRVHSHKPDICAAWPFFRGNLEDAASLEMAKDFCPGIGKAVGHLEFSRQGLMYLLEHGLLHDKDPNAPNALQIDRSRLPVSL